MLEFFHALGMPVIEGYGLTEYDQPDDVNDPDDFRFGTVGRRCRRLRDPDRRRRRDPRPQPTTVFAGYFKDPEATAEVLDADGWFRTGDVGEIDPDGFVTITDRKKDIIVTAGGKNIAPQNLENALKGSRFVSQAIVVGDRSPYVDGADHARPTHWAASAGSTATCRIGRDARVLALVQGVVDEVNRRRVRASSRSSASPSCRATSPRRRAR